ncbi:MAG: hypothetical protein HY231_20845 [Acidobacteria bacterium]|nr:hypothetical protein [Acidobacteriota bacterium]
MMDAAYTAPPELDRLQQRALLVGVVALGLTVAGAFLNREQFFRSYLLAYVYWIGISLGCFAILMIQHLATGAWGIVIRRLLESATRTFPLGLVLFVPIALALFGGHLYIWTDANFVAHDAILQDKAKYLNVPFFLGRTALYFFIWFVIAYFLNKWSRQQDEASDPKEMKRKMQDLSGPSLVLLGGTMTFASIDWVMSLDPHWTSTIFGILFMGGQALSAMAFIITMIVFLANFKPMKEVIAGRHLNDLGKLMLAFVMLWAYFAFSQFLIIWSGNLPEEIPWYLNRLSGAWKLLAGAIILFHFILPFFLLLPRKANRNPRLLVTVALLIIVMRYVDLYWLVGPQVSHEVGGKMNAAFHFSWMDIAAPVGVGGIWLWYFLTQLKKLPLLPINEPQLEGALGEGAGHH